MRTLIAAALGVLLCGAAPSSRLSVVQPCAKARAGDTCVLFSNLTADFDGDGVADMVSIMSRSEGGQFTAGSPNDVVIPALWGKARPYPDQRTAVVEISFGKRHGRFFLLDYVGYFDTPIWQSKTLPIFVAKRGSRQFNEFHAQEKRIKNDILVLGTEAGIDTALYWDGKTFKLFAPAEEP